MGCAYDLGLVSSCPVRLVGQDTGFSFLQQGFESPTGRQTYGCDFFDILEARVVLHALLSKIEYRCYISG